MGDQDDAVGVHRAAVAAADIGALAPARLDDRFITANVVGVGVGVDDVPNRLVSQGSDGGHDRGAGGCGAGVDEQDALLTDLNRDVAPAPTSM